MMKKFTLILFCFFSTTIAIFSQVGINTTSPNATLDVNPTSVGSNIPEGIIAPNLTLSQLVTKNGQYGLKQTGAIVYITDITSGASTGITENVTSTGYYYFDGSIWQSIGGKVILPTEPWMVQGGINEAVANSENIYQAGKVAIGANSSGNDHLYVAGTSTLAKGITSGTLASDASIFNGDIIANDLTVIPNAKSLVVDRQSGKLGMSEYVPKDILYIQKRSGQLLNLTGSGDAERGVVWSDDPTVVTLPNDPAYDFAADGEFTDLMTNNLNIDIDFEKGLFTFTDIDPAETDLEKKRVLVEVSGYVNLTTGGGSIVNLYIQVQRKGTTAWTIIAGSRTIVSGGYTTSIVVSPAATYVYPGDVIRLAVGRPSSSTPWGTARVDRPYGLKYLGALKIAAI